jgi:TolA-binding protein
MVFSVPEFEQLVSSNTRILTKMLKVFSKELRRVHRQTSNIMEKEGYDPEDPEQGLFNVGLYYLKNRRFPQAQYIFGRYLTYYPSGKNAAQAAKNLQLMRSGGSAAPPKAIKETRADRPQAAAAVVQRSSIGRVFREGGVGKSYHEAVNLVSQGNFKQALAEFLAIQAAGEDPQLTAKSSYEIGRCLFMMNSFDECIRHFTGMITRYPKHPDLEDALFFIAQSHENQGKKEMAEVFYKKILAMVPDGNAPVNVKARKALASLKEA